MIKNARILLGGAIFGVAAGHLLGVPRSELTDWGCAAVGSGLAALVLLLAQDRPV